MKLVSSYDTAYEHHERTLSQDHLRTMLADLKLKQDTAAQIALGLCHLLEDAEDLADFEMAEMEALELLRKVREMQGERNYATQLQREMT